MRAPVICIFCDYLFVALTLLSCSTFYKQNLSILYKKTFQILAGSGMLTTVSSDGDCVF